MFHVAINLVADMLAITQQPTHTYTHGHIQCTNHFYLPAFCMPDNGLTFTTVISVVDPTRPNLGTRLFGLLLFDIIICVN